MLGWHACADRLLRGAIPIAPLRSLPSSLFTHGRWVHAVNILIITEDDLSQKMPCIHRANLLIISGHFHFCLTEDKIVGAKDLLTPTSFGYKEMKAVLKKKKSVSAEKNIMNIIRNSLE